VTTAGVAYVHSNAGIRKGFEEEMQALLQKMESSKSNRTVSKNLKALYQEALLRSMETSIKSIVNT
jgi:hypothetical protein